MKPNQSIKAYNPKEIERKWVDSISISRDFDYSKKVFSLAIPPPNVTGSLHLGHALNSTVQDVLVKYYYLKGFNIQWTPGTDHAGIATQLLVEKSLSKKGINLKELSNDELIKEIWKWKEINGDQIINQLRTLGLSCDWDEKKFTLDQDMSHAVNKAFIELFNEGLIYKQKTLVNWDPVLRTAISDLEVISVESKGYLYFFKYFLEDSDEYIIVSTTRPETAFGDTAIAVNPNDDRYSHIVGKKVINVFNNKKISIIADDYADINKGSGAVKITPGHDFNDFEIAKRHGLEMINILNDDGTLNKNVPDDFRGLSTIEARDKILTFMKEKDMYEGEEEVINTIPKGDRSSAVIEPLLKYQWFLNVKDMAEESMKAVKRGDIEFKPKFWENTFFEWMKNIKPWCISRQIIWGHKIPVWTCNNNFSIAAQDEKTALLEYKKKFNKSPDNFTQETDVLDTWFSSGLWPFSTLGWPKNNKKFENFFPTSILVTGFDIIFFWVARMIMMSIKLTKKIPFKIVYIHNLIRDHKGHKMSKTKGNVIDPLELIDQHGTDSLRFYLSSNLSPHNDIKIGKNSLDSYKNFMNKIWNAYNFVKINSEGYEIKNQLKPKNFYDFWIISRFSDLLSKYETYIENCEIEKSATEIYKFFWDDYCDWYIEISKISFLNSENKNTKEILLNIFHDFILLLFPFCPFISSELLSQINKSNKNKELPDKNKYNFESFDEMKFNVLQDFVISVRSFRKNLSIPPAEKIDIFIEKNNKYYEFIIENSTLISKLINLNSIKNYDMKDKMFITTVSRYFKISIRKTSDMDIVSQKNKLLKDLVVINKDLERVSNKLKNSKFLESAPEEVIEREKRICSQSEIAKENIENILNQLN